MRAKYITPEFSTLIYGEGTYKDIFRTFVYSSLILSRNFSSTLDLNFLTFVYSHLCRFNSRGNSSLTYNGFKRTHTV